MARRQREQLLAAGCLGRSAGLFEIPEPLRSGPSHATGTPEQRSRRVAPPAEVAPPRAEASQSEKAPPLPAPLPVEPVEAPSAEASRSEEALASAAPPPVVGLSGAAAAVALLRDAEERARHERVELEKWLRHAGGRHGAL